MRSLFLFAALVLAPAIAGAQGDPLDAKVDCAVFSKKIDGIWVASTQTTIELGSSKFTVAAGDIGPRMLQFGMADLHSVLENACPEKKGDSKRDPRSESEKVK